MCVPAVWSASNYCVAHIITVHDDNRAIDTENAREFSQQRVRVHATAAGLDDDVIILFSATPVRSACTPSVYTARLNDKVISTPFDLYYNPATASVHVRAHAPHTTPPHLVYTRSPVDDVPLATP